jgi:hypothetical protein
MWGKLLCAGGEKVLLVCTTTDDACVWVDLAVYDLGVVGASNVYEGV